MKPSVSRASQPRRHLLRWVWVFGVVLLAGSLVGGRFFLSGNGSSSESDDSSGPMPVVVFAYGDTPKGVLNLAPPFGGRVTFAAEEGNMEIESGTALVQLDDTAARDQMKAAEADLSAAQLALSIANNMAEQHQFQIEQQEQAVIAAKSRLDAEKEGYKKVKRMADKKLEFTEEEVNAAMKKVDAQEAAVKAEEAKLTALKRLKPQLAVDRSEKDVEAKRALRDKAQKFVEDHVVKAPVKGAVLRVMVNKGDMFMPEAKTPAVFFCPSGPRILRAEVEQEWASRVRKGQRVCIRDDSNGQGRWTGVVGRIGDWFTQRRVILPEPVPLHDQRTLECIIEDIKPITDSSAADTFPIRINQRMRVTIQPEGSTTDECK